MNWVLFGATGAVNDNHLTWFKKMPERLKMMFVGCTFYKLRQFIGRIIIYLLPHEPGVALYAWS